MWLLPGGGGGGGGGREWRMGCAAQSQTHILQHCSIMPSIYSTDISTYTEATQTLLILEL